MPLIKPTHPAAKVPSRHTIDEGSSRVRPVTMLADPSRSAATSLKAARPGSYARRADRRTLGVVSLFSGIAGLDSGMEASGARVLEMCESWAPARRVLAEHYPRIPVADDVSVYLPTTDYDVLSAGFPCTDLSHAGSKAGIFGPQSGLVEHVFRIAAATRPEWIVLENVPHLLALHQGAGIAEVVDRLESLGYAWAYRTVDSRFTGVPQRRYRVIILASAVHDPTPLLFGEDTVPRAERASSAASRAVAPSKRRGSKNSSPPLSDRPHGFYWTEGRNGLGLVEGAIPTLKGGSTIGLPSAPAIWFPTAPVGHRFVLPRIEDGERLQGLPVGWTQAALQAGQRDLRWKLLGNAVTRGVGAWIADRLTSTETTFTDQDPLIGRALARNTRWPRSAAGGPGQAAHEVVASDRPRQLPATSLEDIVDVTAAPPLSYRATRGFLSRVDESERRLDARLYADLEAHLASTRPKSLPAAGGSWASSASARGRMRAQRQRDTKPELQMRRELTALGLRYQLQTRPEADLRSRLDIVFKGAKVAVDIRGCFWHSCPLHGTSPKANAERWAAKLERNRERDEQSVQALTERGWLVCVVWEHDDPILKAKEVAAFVEQRRPRPRKRTNQESGL